MATLGEIPVVAYKLKTGALKAIKVLHVVIFGDEGQPRQIRRKLKTFPGFSLDENSETFTKKVDDVKQLELVDLTAVCHILNLDYSGDEETLAKRICNFLNHLESHDDKEEDEISDESEDDPEEDERVGKHEAHNNEESEDNEEGEEAISEATVRSATKNEEACGYRSRERSFALTFRDVEDSLRRFDGRGDYPINKWIDDFEELAELTGWNELQKLIFAKKSLCGIARLFVQSVKGITSWKTLKKLLKEEFEVKVSSAQIHKMLMQRKKRKEESVQEYVLKMREIGSRASVDTEAVIHYIIDGIPDDLSHKVVLYGARSFEDFKEKVRLYETIKAKDQAREGGNPFNFKSTRQTRYEKQNKSDGSQKSQKKEYTRNAITCFNCGVKGHRSNECPSKQRGTKCFSCNNFGHLSSNCPRRSTSENTTQQTTNTEVNTISKSNMVNIEIDKVKLKALFDTGSDVCTMKEDVYNKFLSNINLTTDTLILSGLGGSKVRTLGSFTEDVMVADEELQLTFHVVPQNSSNYEVIIGNEILSEVDVTITKEGVVVHRNREHFMMHMQSVGEENEMADLGHIQSRGHREEIAKMIKTYMPEKTKTTGVEMKIILSDEKPVYEKPRRLPVPEKLIVEKQVMEWLDQRLVRPSSADIARPLSDMLKKNEEFSCGGEACEAFSNLKMKLAENPVLKIFKYGADTELHTDASSLGYGAVLLQRCDNDGQLHPIHYMSRKTTETEKKYTSYELEVLAIVESVKKFRVYLLGNKFKIVTDCQAFTKTMDKKDLTTRVARWALLLEEFQYTIEHRGANRMKHVDALSRYPVVMTVENNFLRRLQAAQMQDEKLKAITKILESDSYEDHFIENGILYKEVDGAKLLMIPKALQTEVIRRAHEQGHFGVRKTESLVNKDYFIPKISRKIEEYIATCVPCILSNRKQGRQEGLLNPIYKRHLPLDTYHLDHCGPFESTKKNYKYIFLVIDAFCKFVWIFPTKTLNTNEVLDKLNILQGIFGNPRRIITDRGGAFRAEDFKEYCENEGIEHVQITTGVPRGNGQIENMVQIVTSSLRRLSCDEPTCWYKNISRLQRAINSTTNRSTNYSPFKLMFGVEMKKKEDMNIFEILQEVEKEIFEEERQELRNDAKEAIKKIQEENKKSFNKKRKIARKYKVDDIVAIRKTQFGTQNKLFPKFQGPYKITRVKGRDRYDVERIGRGDGPKMTSSSADYIKPWKGKDWDSDSPSETDDRQEGRDVGL